MSLFKTEKEDLPLKYLIILIAVAYIFSVAIRLIWVYQMKDISNFHWNNQLMINTNDGYYFASWVQAITEGLHKYNPRVGHDLFRYAIVTITVLSVKLGISIDTAILYMSTIISGLVVIPIILIGRIYGMSIFGFFASLIGSIAWSYYNRTMTGYYDTDMFSAMAPMFILYFLIKLIEQNEMKNIIYASVMLSIYPFLYDQGQAIVYAMGLMYMMYMVIFNPKNSFTYKSIVLISLSLMPIFTPIKIILFVVIYFLFLKKEFDLKVFIYLSIIFLLSFLFFGNVFGLIFSKVIGYTERGIAQEGLHFFSVNQTVREAGRIPFKIMAYRISGSQIGVIASLLGYILMLIRFRSMILALPLIGIGIFSLFGGLRFTVYAVPVAAMGIVFLFYIIVSFIKNKITKYVTIAILTAIALYPNVKHIIGYKVPTVFIKDEVKVLEKLKSISKPQDYTITWWDYGYPIWYYSDTNTLIDGGKHNDDNYIVSKILTTSDQVLAANLSRLSIETYVKYKQTVADKIFNNDKANQKDPNKFLELLSNNNIKLPKKTVDIYLYLPNRMLNIFPTVALFSNLDLKTGKTLNKGFFYKTNYFKNSRKYIFFGRNIRLDKKNGILIINNREYALNRFVKTFYDNYGILHKKIQVVNKDAFLNIIYMSNYRKFLILDNKMYNSLFIQLFVLENYNNKLFKPVILSPVAKVYKLLK